MYALGMSSFFGPVVCYINVNCVFKLIAVQLNM